MFAETELDYLVVTNRGIIYRIYYDNPSMDGLGWIVAEYRTSHLFCLSDLDLNLSANLSGWPGMD